MSNTYPKPISLPFSGNPFYVPESPTDTINAVACGLATLCSVDLHNMEADAALGLERMIESLRYAAAMLANDLDTPAKAEQPSLSPDDIAKLKDFLSK